jgi:hypothetical protein
MIKLTETQINVLSGAAQRDDGAAMIPEKRKPGSVAKLFQALIAQKLVREVRTKSRMPIWRRDEAGRPVSLVITSAGRKAIETNEDSAAKISAKRTGKPVSGEATTATSAKVSGAVPTAGREETQETELAPSSKTRTAAAAASEDQHPRSPSPVLPRAGSKQALLVNMLMSEEGTTLDALIAATGWLPHTVRAAMTGLRKRGYNIACYRKDSGKSSTYRIGLNAEASAA